MFGLRDIAIFAVACMMGAMVTVFYRWPPMQTSEWAAWVQAFGAIGAIGVAIYISWAQAMNDRRQEKEHVKAEDVTILMNTQAIIKNATDIIDGMPDLFMKEEDIEIYFKEHFSRPKIVIQLRRWPPSILDGSSGGQPLNWYFRQGLHFLALIKH